ncbi:MAG TPA: hypothetical protein VJL88_06970 [Nitrospira sp.]|nr:hypothetical protein [Nitrospira sp.]
MAAKTLLQIFVLGLVVRFSSGEAAAVTISIDPLRTFLYTYNDPWSGSGSVANSIPIVLSDIGVSGGDTIQLEMLGDWYDGHAGYIGVDVSSMDVVSEMIGVFSSDNTLLSPTVLNRVPGSLDAGISITSWNTLFGDMPTDIPHDFGITNTFVQVPVGATHLFVAAHDIYYSDNSDPDGDFAVRITRISAVPEPSTLLLLIPTALGCYLLSRTKMIRQ